MSARNPGGGSFWTSTITPAQRETVWDIRGRQDKTPGFRGADGWSLFLMPSCPKHTYVELRHYVPPGTVYRWLLGADGEVLAHKRESGTRGGLFPRLEPETVA